MGAAGRGVSRLYLLDNVRAATFAKTYGDKPGFYFGCDERGMTRKSAKERCSYSRLQPDMSEMPRTR